MAERYTIGLFKGYGRFAHHVIEMIVLLPCFFQFIVIKREMICVSDDTFMEVGKYILGNIVVITDSCEDLFLYPPYHFEGN